MTEHQRTAALAALNRFDEARFRDEIVRAQAALRNAIAACREAAALATRRDEEITP